MDYPRLLVVANNGFSKQNNNGRTLGSLLKGWPKDKIAQFCISSDGPDFDICENYYCVTDGDVLHSTLSLRQAQRRTLSNACKIDSNSSNGHVKHYKTTINMLARNIAWNIGFWWGDEFNKWLESFNPQIVLLQNGESFFMHNLTLKISNKYNSRLAIFNTEGYYFFLKDYFAKDGFLGRLLFNGYQALYKYYYKCFMKSCVKQIYGNELLRQDYDREFGNTDSCVIYTGSNIAFVPVTIKPAIPVFCYLGNMGFNRPDALIEFAEVLQSIDSRYKLDVYGFAKDKAMEDKLNGCNAIRFHGAVSYDEVLNVIEGSDYLVHVESQCEIFRESLRYGFSTKIADSIASGKIFILYSSPEIAGAQYIMSNKAGIFASTKDDLKNKIIEVLNSEEVKSNIEVCAKKTALMNHDPVTNADKMHKYLID